MRYFPEILAPFYIYLLTQPTITITLKIAFVISRFQQHVHRLFVMFLVLSEIDFKFQMRRCPWKTEAANLSKGT